MNSTLHSLKAALIGLLLTTPILARAQNADSKAITDLFMETKEHAVLAETDAMTLESYTLSRVSWESYAKRLNEMRQHAIDLTNDFNQLSALRDEGSPWQQGAIDRANPMLQEMANSLTATIKHFNDNKNRIEMPPFPDYVKANRVLMTRTANLISDVVEYSEAKAKANLLEQALSLPVTAKSE